MARGDLGKLFQGVRPELDFQVQLEHLRLGREGMQAEESVCAYAWRLDPQGPQGKEGPGGDEVSFGLVLKGTLDGNSLLMQVCSEQGWPSHSPLHHPIPTWVRASQLGLTSSIKLT